MHLSLSLSLSLCLDISTIVHSHEASNSKFFLTKSGCSNYIFFSCILVCLSLSLFTNLSLSLSLSLCLDISVFVFVFAHEASKKSIPVWVLQLISPYILVYLSVILSTHLPPSLSLSFWASLSCQCTWSIKEINPSLSVFKTNFCLNHIMFVSQSFYPSSTIFVFVCLDISVLSMHMKHQLAIIKSRRTRSLRRAQFKED